jgi:hypothetical protein
MAKLILLTTLIFCCVAAKAQDVLQDTVVWNSIRAVNQSDQSEAIYNCSFTTFGDTAIDWTQNNGAKVYHFTATSTSGSWSNISQDGQVTFNLQKGETSGTAVISRSSGQYTIHLQLFPNNLPPQDYVFYVATANLSN